MLKSERKQFILEKVLKEKFVSLETLVQELGTSESTVRRDLDELEAESKLRRVHGGAESLHFLQEEESNKEKSIKNIQVKSKIAVKFIIDSIHSKKGLVKIQLTDLIERNPSDTSICRRFYLPTDDDRWNISLDQLGRMVNRVGHHGYRWIDNFLYQKFIGRPSIDKDHVMIFDQFRRFYRDF